MISDFEKFIYNTHLKTHRQLKNQPYKLRKDFDGIPDKDFIALKKLSHFFNNHKEISPAVFFLASYKIYKDEPFFDLNHFNTLRAIKAFNIFTNDTNNLDPDSPEQIDFTKKSLIFIYKFCKNNNILIEDYCKHKTNNMHTFFIHLKNRDINLYSLFGFTDFSLCLKGSDIEVLRFMFNESFLDRINLLKVKFLNSKKCNLLVSNGLQRIKNNYKKELNLRDNHLL
jgi:hypothetical protein